MRIAGNRIRHMADFYHRELAALYEPSEIDAMLRLVFFHYLGLEDSSLALRAEELLNQSDLILIYNCGKQLAEGKPLQYILGEAEFMTLRFKVNHSVLIPRPETEELVDLIIKENKQAQSFLDLGTGSGCIPVSIKKNIPSAVVAACDISDEALKTASLNAELNHAAVQFFKADILGKSWQGPHEKFEVLVSNPPYIKKEEGTGMQAHVTDHEPHLALFVDGSDPVIFYRKIIDLCKDLLEEKGRLYFELNPLTSADAEEYAKSTALFSNIFLLKDMSGKVRFMKAVKK